MTEILYFDYAAATPMDEKVVAAMTPYFTEHFFNPSSPYLPAVAVKKDYVNAKHRLAMAIGGRGDDVIMTAGATESINLAFGWIEGHVVSSEIEHDAVLAAANQHPHTLVSPTEQGIIRPELVQLAIRSDTELVSIQLANNEIGTIQPIKQIADVVKAERDRRQSAGENRPIFFHCDASQGLGYLDVNVARLGVDLLTLNAAKVYGPKQVGLLWRNPNVTLVPSIVGGGQEMGLRSGTENVAGTIGFAVALELSEQRRPKEVVRIRELRDELEAKLREAIPTAIASGHRKKRLPGSLHISVPGIDAERILYACEARGLLLATGSACAANKGTRSHVLSAIGMNDRAADGSLRLTLGRHTTREQCQAAAAILISEVHREMKRVSHVS